ncbi:MAG: PKD domain-containing protein, partial [Acidimicrobiales bacterium]
MALAGAVSSTAPTPPDLFVAYGPLASSGTAPGADTVQSFDTSGLAPLGSAPVGAQPIGEAVSPDGGTVYVLNSGTDSITPVSTLGAPASEATIPLPAGYTPAAIAVTPDGQDAYVVGAAPTASSLQPALWQVTLTGKTPGTIARTVDLPSGSSPTGLALTPNGLEALVTDYSGGTVIPVNLSNGHVGTPIGVGLTPGSGSNPMGIGVSPNGKDAFVADSGDGSLSEISLSNNHVSVVPLEPGAWSPQNLAVSPDGSTVWVTEENSTAPGSSGFVVPVSLPSLSVEPPVTVGLAPNGVAISPDGSTVYVANETDAAAGTNTNTGSISAVPTDGSAPTALDTNIDPAAVLVTPDEAPVASFTSATAPAGKYTAFDASASYSLTNGGLSYSWDFGDGSAVLTTASPTVKHIYPLPGSYTVTLSVTDISGTSTEVVYTGQYVLNNGGPSA